MVNRRTAPKILNLFYKLLKHFQTLYSNKSSYPSHWQGANLTVCESKLEARQLVGLAQAAADLANFEAENIIGEDGDSADVDPCAGQTDPTECNTGRKIIKKSSMEKSMSGKCSCRYGTFMEARGRLNWPMSTTCCCMTARISCQKRTIWTDWKTRPDLFLFFFPYGGKWRGIRMAIGTGYRGGGVSTCLLYCGVRVFVWWYGVCVLQLVSSMYE